MDHVGAQRNDDDVANSVSGHARGRPSCQLGAVEASLGANRRGETDQVADQPRSDARLPVRGPTAGGLFGPLVGGRSLEAFPTVLEAPRSPLAASTGLGGRR
jgi:hypothetical protein